MNGLLTPEALAVARNQPTVGNIAEGLGHEFLSKLKGAEAVYFLGGDQWPYVQLFREDRAAAQVISDGNQAGNIVVGGTSAGLAILGEYVFTAQYGSLSSAEILEDYYSESFYQNGKPAIADDVLSLKWMDDVLTETHFTDDGMSSNVNGRNVFRLGRFLSFMGAVVAQQPSGLGRSVVKGLAVDDDTALCVEHNGTAKVHGTKNVYFAGVQFAEVNPASKHMTIYGSVGMNWYSSENTDVAPLSLADTWTINQNAENYVGFSLIGGDLQLVAGSWPATFPLPQ